MRPKVITYLEIHSVQFSEKTRNGKSVVVRVAFGPADACHLKLELANAIQCNLKFLVI